jgi:hypothetical protein
MSRERFAFLIVVLTLFSCEKKVDEKQFEQDVLSEIFLKVVDSTYMDIRLYKNSPQMGEDIYDKNGKWIGRNLTGQKKRDIEHEIKIEALKKDTINLIIAIGNGGLINDKTELQQHNSRKFIFKHLSELPEDDEYENWIAKYPKFAGALIFSNIKFDSRKENGTIEVGYYCGGKCGLGYIVTIKRVDHQWVISKVEDTWIS